MTSSDGLFLDMVFQELSMVRPKQVSELKRKDNTK